MHNPVRIFVAATPAEYLPMRVLDFSIRETTNSAIELAAIYQFGRKIPTPADINNRPRTPFSFQRFLIPELCNFTGKAIYLDADMQVFGDITAVWNQNIENFDLQTTKESSVGRKSQFSVMLLNCEKLDWSIEKIIAELDFGKFTYESLVHDMSIVNAIGLDIPSAWNSLEQYKYKVTKLLHYTDMNTQPWISINNPLGNLWISCLQRAIDSGFISSSEIQAEVDAGHIRPSLIAQIESGISDPLKLSPAARKLDKLFIAPYRMIKSGHSKPWTQFSAAIRANLRRNFYRLSLARFFR